MNYTIILVRPNRSRNVGAICRVVQNFGNPKLIIVDNKADLSKIEFRKTARHAKSLISDIILEDSLEDALKNNHITYSIATTARQAIISTTRISFSPKDILWNELGDNPAIVFGSESYGLENNDVALCDYIIKIPTSDSYSSINLSHAVAIMCYEFFTNSQDRNENYQSAPFELKQQLELSFSNYIEKFLRKERAHISKEIFHNLISRSRITEGEVSNLIGAFKAWEFHYKKLEERNSSQ